METIRVRSRTTAHSGPAPAGLETKRFYLDPESLRRLHRQVGSGKPLADRKIRPSGRRVRRDLVIVTRYAVVLCRRRRRDRGSVVRWRCGEEAR